MHDPGKEKMSDSNKQNQNVGTVAELFAGVGGFRIGLEASGWETIFSNQWEPSTKTQHASDVYVYQFGDAGHTNEDISKVIDAFEEGEINIPKTSMLVGGFPCQDYSVAKSKNSSHGLAGKKGVLWWEILRLVRLNRPEIVFLENVDRLLKSPATQRGRDFAIMLASLADEGYFVEWRVVNAAEYGFPQRRRRVFIVAKHKETFVPPLLLDANYLLKDATIAQALPVQEVFKNEVVEFEILGDLAEITENFDLGGQVSPFKNAGLMLNRKVISADVIPVSQEFETLESVLVEDSDVPEEFFVDEKTLESWKYLKGSKREERTHRSGATYVYAEGAMSFPDATDAPARTILTGEGGKSASRFKHIVQTSSGRFRRLTPVELERLNGFPDDWTKNGVTGPISDIKRAFFMGNALVIGVVKRIGQQLAKEYSSL